jgi:hypothetical protein
MLTHIVTGPNNDGLYHVGYRTPGCEALTVMAVCVTEDQANAEADRLNKQQVNKEKEVRYVRELRGLTGVYPELESRGL